MELPIVIDLDKPIKHGTKEIDQIVIERDVTVEDVMDIDLKNMKLKDLAQIIGRLSGLPTLVIAKIPLREFGKISEAMKDFLPAGQ